MADEDTAAAEAPEAPAPKKKQGSKTAKKEAKGGRALSTIAFPYMDLEAAISIASGILKGGGVPLSRDQLAGVLVLSAGSGNFVTKVATARMFGLVGFAQGKYELTDLGFSILDSDEKRQRKARAEAFLTVPLYKRTYEEFRGRQLPPRPHGLEQAFLKFGVAPKQRKSARIAFDKSATQAGFFPNGNDRLIEPIIGAPSGAFVRDSEDEDEVEDREPDRRTVHREKQASGHL